MDIVYCIPAMGTYSAPSSALARAFDSSEGLLEMTDREAGAQQVHHQAEASQDRPGPRFATRAFNQLRHFAQRQRLDELELEGLKAAQPDGGFGSLGGLGQLPSAEFTPSTGGCR